MMNFEAKAKWDAWNGNKGKSKEDCWAAYIEEFNKQKADFLESFESPRSILQFLRRRKLCLHVHLF